MFKNMILANLGQWPYVFLTDLFILLKALLVVFFFLRGYLKHHLGLLIISSWKLDKKIFIPELFCPLLFCGNQRSCFFYIKTDHVSHITN